MKITDSKVVQSGEKAFLNAVKDYLDWNAIREVVTKKMKQCAIESKGGELVSHANSVAFRMDLHCAMDVSIIFDRDGTLISDEEPLTGFSMKETASVDSGSAQQPVSPRPFEGGKEKKKSTEDLAPRSPAIEERDEADDDEDVLELNDLLDEFQPEKDTPSSPRRGSSVSGDDDGMDLETLFFKDKADDDEFDSVADEAGAFWEDKK